MVWDETKSTKLCNTQIYMPVYSGTEITWNTNGKESRGLWGLVELPVPLIPELGDRGRWLSVSLRTV